jgi:hypothetical protein
MFCIYARTAPLQGLPALGIVIAGGTDNGLISGLRPVYHFFQADEGMMGNPWAL